MHMPRKTHIRKPSHSVIGARIDSLCLEHHTWKSELAEILDTNRGGLARWRTRESPPRSIATLIAIADHFGVSLDWLTGREERREAVGARERWPVPTATPPAPMARARPKRPRRRPPRSTLILAPPDRLEIEERLKVVRGAKLDKVRRGKAETLTVRELNAVFGAGAGRDAGR